MALSREQELHGKALCTRTAELTGGGNSVALVGSQETVAAALMEHIELGVDINSARGYDTLNDAVDFGRHVIPLVRQEVAHRESTRRTA